MDIGASQRIYQELINGGVINKKTPAGGHLVDNSLYDELASSDNRPHYDLLYRCIGYELKELGECFFLNEIGKNEILSDAAMKIQAMLVILVRGTTQIPLLTSILTEYTAGLGKEHLERIGEQEEYQHIMRAVGLRNSFAKELENVLIGRKLAHWNGKERLVLSSGGVALLDHLHLQMEIESSKASDSDASI